MPPAPALPPLPPVPGPPLPGAPLPKVLHPPRPPCLHLIAMTDAAPIIKTQELSRSFKEVQAVQALDKMRRN